MPFTGRCATLTFSVCSIISPSGVTLSVAVASNGIAPFLPFTNKAVSFGLNADLLDRRVFAGQDIVVQDVGQRINGYKTCAEETSMSKDLVSSKTGIWPGWVGVSVPSMVCTWTAMPSV